GEQAQAWSADARLYLLRLRQSAGVVSPVVANERPLAPRAFEGALSLEVGDCRAACRLRLLAAGAWGVAVRATGRQCRELAAQRLSRAQLLRHAHRRARPLRHTARASHDASRDQGIDGDGRAARHMLSRWLAILVRDRTQGLDR